MFIEEDIETRALVLFDFASLPVGLQLHFLWVNINGKSCISFGAWVDFKISMCVHPSPARSLHTILPAGTKRPVQPHLLRSSGVVMDSSFKVKDQPLVDSVVEQKEAFSACECSCSVLRNKDQHQGRFTLLLDWNAAVETVFIWSEKSILSSTYVLHVIMTFLSFSLL